MVMIAPIRQKACQKRGTTVKTIKWLIREYRHEDQEGKYYLNSIMQVWLSGAKYGFVVGFLPVLVWWILK